MRPSKRQADELRHVTLEAGVSRHAEGSCLITAGGTKVLCTASVDERVPPWMRNSGNGWVTAEYGMLPRSTNSRMQREAAKGKQSGRTQEIQRLIGRSLRAIVDMQLLGERQITIDCDVIEADGGTRCASITGAYVALKQATDKLVAEKKIRISPLIGQVAAISCGVYQKTPVLDLDYDEDSVCHMDANFVLSETGGIIEIQCTAEEDPVEEAVFMQLMALAKKGIGELTEMQKAALITP